MDEWLRALDDARADERSLERERERRLRVLDEEAATLVGTLVDLAERGSVIRVSTAAGRTHTGQARLVGTDFVVVGDVWLAVQGIGAVRQVASERGTHATGDRAAADLRLAEAIARLVPDRPRLALVVAGGDVIAGELRAVGADVITIRLDGDDGYAYVPSSSVLESNVNQIG